MQTSAFFLFTGILMPFSECQTYFYVLQAWGHACIFMPGKTRSFFVLIFQRHAAIGKKKESLGIFLDNMVYFLHY